jgi:glycosyltransferase involved in cell wall biosynthesis
MSESTENLTSLSSLLVKIGDYLEGISTTTGLLYDPPEKYARELQYIRTQESYLLPYTEKEPLVTIRISSYKGYKYLIERCLPSVLAQTYKNYEVIIVGDNDPDGPLIEMYLTKLNDKRFNFIQREYRGPYPDDSRQAWLISGAHAFNVASRVSNGHWISKLDQDDAWEPNHLSDLLQHARKHRSEIVYASTRCHFQDESGRPPIIVGEFPPKKGSFALTASLCHGSFKIFEMNELAYLWSDPGDWGLAWRLWLAGAKFDFLDKPLANIFITPKKNQGYYEHQYQMLLEIIAKMSEQSPSKRKVTRSQAKIKTFLYKVLYYIKKRSG